MGVTEAPHIYGGDDGSGNVVDWEGWLAATDGMGQISRTYTELVYLQAVGRELVPASQALGRVVSGEFGPEPSAQRYAVWQSLGHMLVSAQSNN
jgi:hypothetical protein